MTVKLKTIQVCLNWGLWLLHFGVLTVMCLIYEDNDTSGYMYEVQCGTI
jgi:hypothetical protein